MTEPLHIESIPSLHINANELTEKDNILLQTWRPEATRILSNLNHQIKFWRKEDLSSAEKANIVAKCVPFDGYDFWSSEELRQTAKEILESLPEPSIDVVIRVLSNHIKPRFINTPHPHVNPASGRRLPDAAVKAGIYELDRQQWKIRPGTAKLLLWCIVHLKPQDFEAVWHLVIPPTMSFLDDHQAYFRLQGISIVNEFLRHVPVEHLERTGVNGLLISSLRRSMIHLHTPSTPTLLRMSVRTLLKVIDCTTTPHSQSRFDQLCGLVGEGIIGSVWVYASQEVDTIESSLEVLPDILRALGLGSVRYLKAILSQLVHNLIPLDPQHASVPLQITSLQAMEAIIQVCRPRIHQWRTLIIDGLGRCWVSSMEQPNVRYKARLDDLKSALRRVAVALASACPSVVENEYRTLLACDQKMFGTLLSLDDQI